MAPAAPAAPTATRPRSHTAALVCRSAIIVRTAVEACVTYSDHVRLIASRGQGRAREKQNRRTRKRTARAGERGELSTMMMWVPLTALVPAPRAGSQEAGVVRRWGGPGRTGQPCPSCGWRRACARCGGCCTCCVWWRWRAGRAKRSARRCACSAPLATRSTVRLARRAGCAVAAAWRAACATAARCAPRRKGRRAAACTTTSAAATAVCTAGLEITTCCRRRPAWVPASAPASSTPRASTPPRACATQVRLTYVGYDCSGAAYLRVQWSSWLVPRKRLIL